MRYFLAAVLAMVLAIPAVDVGAGDLLTGDIFFIVGLNAADEQENLFCGDLSGSKSWLLITLAPGGGGAGSTVVAGEGAKVGKGPRMKDKGAARRFEVVDSARPRGTEIIKSDVTATMKAGLNSKTNTVAARVTDKTNGETLESPGASSQQAYVVTNAGTLVGVDSCAAVIDELEASGPLPQSVRGLAARLLGR